MNNPKTQRIVVISLAALVVGTAVVVRTRTLAQYDRTRKAYEEFQRQQTIRQRAIDEGHANEQRLAQLKAAVAANPADVRSRWALADSYQKLHMLSPALDQLQEIAKLDPKSQEAAVGIGNTQLALGRIQEAERSYHRATEKWPKNLEAWQGDAAAWFQLRRYREAGTAGRQALILDPNDRDSKIIVASSALEFALEYPDENATREPLQIARALFSMMAKDDPKDGQTQYQLGLSMFLLHDKKGCLPYLGKAAELLPDRANIAADYGQILISNGKYAEARAFVYKALTRMPNVPGLHHLIAESYQYDSDARSLQEAIAEARKAVELAPKNALYWDRLGAAYLKAQDTEHARQAFEQSLLLNANRSYPYQQLAGIYTRMGDPKRASAAAKMATRMTANDETMRHLESLSQQYPGAVNLVLIRADRYRDLKMYGPARDLYDQALKLDPKNTTAQRAIEAIDKIRMPMGTPK